MFECPVCGRYMDINQPCSACAARREIRRLEKLAYHNAETGDEMAYLSLKINELKKGLEKE